MRYRRFLWLALPVAALAALWAGRQPLTAAGVRQYLSSRGVAARFEIAQLGTRRVVLENIALGRTEGASARRITIDYALGLTPRVVRISAEGATLHATVRADGTFDLGALQALVPPPSDEPLSLPDYDLQLSDARVQLATPAGPVALRLYGQGIPAQTFHARVSGTSARLSYAGARIEGVRLTARATLRDNRLLVAAQATATDVHAPEYGQATRAALAFQGALPLEEGAVAGAWAVRSADTRLPGGRADMVRAQGLITFTPSSNAAWLRLQASATQARPDAASLAPLRAAVSSLPASPLDPLKTGLAQTADALAKGITARADATLAWRDDAGALRLHSLRLGDLAAVDARDLRIAMPSLRIDGSAALRLTPVGLPAVSGQATDIVFRPDGHSVGVLTLNPVRWRTKDLDLALGKTTLALSPAGARVASHLAASLHTEAARIEGLRAPIALDIDPDGGVRAPGGCQTLNFARLRAQTLDIGPATARVCAAGGSLFTLAANGAVRGQATLALSPLVIRQEAARLTLAPARIALALSGSTKSPILVLNGRHLSAAAEVSPNTAAIQADALSLRWQDGSADLMLSGGAASIAGQPVTVSELALAATLDATGTMRVRNATALVRNTDPRPPFAPIRLSDVRADYDGKTIKGDGALLLHAKAQRIGRLRFRHDLGTAEGAARVDIDGLTFSPELEAYELTELARGQVENVSGTVTANADFAWGQAISAKGAIAFQNVSLATAALGPISGINGEIALDDLLAPHSPLNQTVTIDSINPGVEVAHGVLRFQLLPGFHLNVQDARWPFAGGDLFLEPVVIDPAAGTQRVTFRAANMDAALLLEQFDLKNLRVTGRLDGAFPMIAEGAALRIENGRITTQPGGGLIQYVGEVGKEVTGPSKLAFDALQRFRYDTAALDLNGDLAGEIVAAIRFSGENQAPVSPAGGLPIKADGLPFKFNVTVRAPFRGLLNTASGLFDARKVIEQARPIDTDEIPGAAPQ
ncbi:MAG: hypothetical protein E6R12_03365 [Sphingomonadales bacterium]|nr:MAG: hypothetical protein E6R12_03365 [Sphingomonadales bacterium]